MGCDIHFFTEVKIDGVWHTYSNPEVPRDYQAFAKLAGVRNDYGITPISEPKGLPDDTSLVFNIYYKNKDVKPHSCSWLSSEEMADFETWWWHMKQKLSGQELFGYVFGNNIGDFHKFPGSMPKEIQDVRAVFFFDN